MFMDLEYLKTKYKKEKLSSREIGKLLNCSHRNVLNWLKKYNIKTRSRTEMQKGKARTSLFDTTYFKSIDSEDKAYFLGFLFADGCIVKNCLKWTSKDLSAILSFMSNIKSKNKINYNKIQDEYRIGLGSVNMTKDLQKLNFCERKAYRMVFPKIKKPLLSHFIRGYFDGDGCFYVQKSKTTKLPVYPRLEFYSCCEGFLKSVNRIFDDIGHIRYKAPTHVFTLGFNGKKALKIIKILYSDSNYYLLRKKQKLESYLKLEQEYVDNGGKING